MNPDAPWDDLPERGRERLTAQIDRIGEEREVTRDDVIGLCGAGTARSGDPAGAADRGHRLAADRARGARGAVGPAGEPAPGAGGRRRPHGAADPPRQRRRRDRGVSEGVTRGRTGGPAASSNQGELNISPFEAEDTGPPA